MTVTQESEGRLNAFAKEPKIEVVPNDASRGNGSWLFLIAGISLIIVLIAFSVTIK